MKTIKVSEATNIQLDWLVAKCEGRPVLPLSRLSDGKWGVRGDPYEGVFDFEIRAYTTDGNQLLPIWEREGICTRGVVGGFYAWYPQCPPKSHDARLLVAVARCYVTSKLGETVEVPEELT